MVAIGICIGCSTPSVGSPDASMADANMADEASDVLQVPLPCVGSTGGATDTACGQAFQCGPQSAGFRIDCVCGTRKCSCAHNGLVYRSVPFDCDAGCAFPIRPDVLAACGLVP